MHSKPDCTALRGLSRAANHSLGAALFCLVLGGCAGTLTKRSDTLALATAPVVDQAAAAYTSAEKLNEIKVDYQAAEDFGPTYNPRNTPVLLSEQDIKARLALLEALQCYVSTLVQITHDRDSPALDAAARSLGNSLAGLGNDLAPVFESALNLSAPASTLTTTTTSSTTAGVTTTTSSTATTAAAGPVTPEVEKGLSTAVKALGLYLVNKKINADLPAIIQKMDPTIAAICELLAKDLTLIEDQEKRDYDSLLDGQRDFIVKNQAGSNATVAHPLDPEQRREQIMKLPEMVRQQRSTEAQLKELHAAIVKLEATHHEVAEDARGKNSELISQKLQELAAAGSNLGKFYSSLPGTAK